MTSIKIKPDCVTFLTSILLFCPPGGLTPSVGDSSRSSHHKSKKKKKKHKKHKHKHKHDKGDRDPPADQPRERLVLNMSLKGLKGAAAREVSDDDSDSELEV